MHLLAHRRGRGATPSQSASGTSSAIRVLSRDRGFPQFPHSSSLKTGRHLNSNDVEVHVRHLMPSPRCSSLTVGKHRKLAGSGVAGRHSRSMRRSLDHAAPASSSRRSPQRQGLLRRSETRAASVGARFLGLLGSVVASAAGPPERLNTLTRRAVTPGGGVAIGDSSTRCARCHLL